MKAIRCLFDAKPFDFALQFRSTSVFFLLRLCICECDESNVLYLRQFYFLTKRKLMIWTGESLHEMVSFELLTLTCNGCGHEAIEGEWATR